MQRPRTPQATRRLHELLRRDHTLHGGILVGLDGCLIEIQARALHVLREPVPWAGAVTISGMARGAVREALDRITGAFTKVGCPTTEVTILVNLVPVLIGPPGEGKSLLASALPGILPRLSAAEIVQLTQIYSACGALDRDGVAVTRRPVRPVHPTASKQALVGGGSPVPRPGEVTLAHLGVLFLDELAEFSRSALDALRQPLEAGAVCLARVGATRTYPARFTLVAALNPCPCGFWGTDQCVCRDADVRHYQRKLSGPIRDRIDLAVALHRLTAEERFGEPGPDASPGLRERVEAARAIQARRYRGTAIPFNAALPAGAVRGYGHFSAAGWKAYRAVVEGNALSTRAMDRLAKVARTVADLGACATIEPAHVTTAGRYAVGGLLREGLE
jgi:magnesium chelatase family protein